MRNYNIHLKGMVDNCRDDLSRTGVDATSYTNEELYRIIDYWACCETAEEQFEAIRDDVINNVRR